MGIHDQLSNQCLAYKADYTLLVYACLHNWIPIQKKKKKGGDRGLADIITGMHGSLFYFSYLRV